MVIFQREIYKTDLKLSLVDCEARVQEKQQVWSQQPGIYFSIKHIQVAIRITGQNMIYMKLYK